jgi:hypothetical protein
MILNSYFKKKKIKAVLASRRFLKVIFLTGETRKEIALDEILFLIEKELR